MKFLINESQYKRVFLEQPDEKFDAPENKKIAQLSNIQLNLDVDDLIDIFSAIIDGIPGIGNLISAGIDITHTLSYCIRYYFSKTIEEKIEYGTLAFITLGATFIPVQGNSLPIMARMGLKQVLNKTPKEIVKIGKKLRIYDKTIIFLSKGKFKYSLLILLAKIMGSELAEKLDVVTENIYAIYKNFKNYPNISNPLLALYKDLTDLRKDCDTAILLSKHI